MASKRSEPLVYLDVFAEPVTLKFKNFNSYKTNVGGCVSVGFFTLVVFIVAAFLRSLISGYDLNAVTTTYDLITTEEELLEPTDIQSL